MSLLGIDIGGTKVAFALFSKEGTIIKKETLIIGNRSGEAVGKMITDKISDILDKYKGSSDKIESIGISVPGIYHSKTGTVWAPNIQEWQDYPVLKEVETVSSGIPVVIDSDRACSILGETWQGNAKGCRNAAFLAVGTGIGAGFLVNGEILRGSHDIAGAIGWMALDRPYIDKYGRYGCFEYHASGEGIARIAREWIKEHKEYEGELANKSFSAITAYDVFRAYKSGDLAAVYVIQHSIGFWGMVLANIVSLFNPEKIILGGGIFGPAAEFIDEIREEAIKWAQPVSMKLVSIELSSLAGDAGVFGAGYLAMKNLEKTEDKINV